MNTAAMGMSAAGFLVVMGTLVIYLRTIPRGTVPVQVGSLVTGLWLGSGLAAAAIVWSFQGSGSAHVGVIAPAAFALMMGAFFLWVVGQRKVPAGDLQVKVGDKLLSFAATTSDGAGFSSDELAGKRTLLKFFRGGW